MSGGVWAPVDDPARAQHLEQLQRKIGQERGERERLERLVVEVTEALRPVRGYQPHPIVDVWSGAVLKAQKALDAFANEKVPAQAVSEPDQVMAADERQSIEYRAGEGSLEFYKRKAQSHLEALEIEKAKVVDLERQLEIELARVADRDVKLASLDDSAQKAWGAEAAARSALREMAKLV